MAQLNLPIMPSSPMFIGDEGRIMTVEWQEFFRSLFDRVGGIELLSANESENLSIAEAYSTPIDFSKRINELERLINALLVPKSYDKEIETLKILLTTIFEPKSYDKNLEEIEFFISAIQAGDT